MTKGLAWTVEEETQLKALLDANVPIQVVAEKLGRHPGAIMIKCQRLGLKMGNNASSTKLPLPEELPSVEEALIMLAGALEAATAPGLSKSEVQRLYAIARIAKTYKEILADYINYREIESKLKDMEVKYATLLRAKDKNDAPEGDSTAVGTA